MGLLNRLRNFFRPEPPSPPSLRNKRGGLAFVRHFGAPHGADALSGRVVTTVRLNDAGNWQIDPELSYVLKADIMNNGRLFLAGTTATVIGLHDDHLEPLRNPGDEERSQERDMHPPVPVKETSHEL